MARLSKSYPTIPDYGATIFAMDTGGSYSFSDCALQYESTFSAPGGISSKVYAVSVAILAIKLNC